MATDSQLKAAGLCRNCGKALAVWQSPNGDVSPIGSRQGCTCGSTEFRLL